jgi:peptidoglycan/xylan/chitin deacetylase (PgdA/CDA1 family)
VRSKAKVLQFAKLPSFGHNGHMASSDWLQRADRIEAGKPPRLYWLRQWSIPPGVYIFYYHSILDEDRAAEWERAYTKIATPAAAFRAHLDWLCQHMTPLSLSDLLTLPAEEYRKRPYFSIQFDDGYTTLLEVAQPILQAYPITPAVFINADFAGGKAVYYRVLGALMAARGQTQGLIQALQKARFPPPDRDVFDFLKDHYRAGDTEQAVTAAWQAENGEALPQGVHLTWEQIHQLVRAGWQIGNHTAGHLTLAQLTLQEHEQQIMGGERAIRAAGFDPLPCLSYPNGASKFVGENTFRWLEVHPNYHGFLGAGGMNLAPSRQAWLRIPVGDWSLKTLIRQIKREALLSRHLWD